MPLIHPRDYIISKNAIMMQVQQKCNHKLILTAISSVRFSGQLHCLLGHKQHKKPLF